MKIEWGRVAGITVVVLAVLIVSLLISRSGFRAFEYAGPPTELVEVETATLGAEVSKFLWTYRLIDLMAQAFILFVAAACCAAVLRADEEK